MARIETWFEQDLKKPVPVRKLEGVFNEDSQANVIGVQLYDDGVALTSISGSVTGYFLLADGTTTSISGTKSGGKASVVIPPAAYKVTGPITITVRIIDGSNITTVCACVGLVMLTKTPVATPAGSTVADWSAQISAQLAACQAAADAVGATVAVPFNEAVANDAGTYVTSSGHMYYLPNGHTANVSLANTTKVETNCGNELTSLKSALNIIKANTKNIASYDPNEIVINNDKISIEKYETGITVKNISLAYANVYEDITVEPYSIYVISAKRIVTSGKGGISFRLGTSQGDVPSRPMGTAFEASSSSDTERKNYVLITDSRTYLRVYLWSNWDSTAQAGNVTFAELQIEKNSDQLMTDYINPHCAYDGMLRMKDDDYQYSDSALWANGIIKLRNAIEETYIIGQNLVWDDNRTRHICYRIEPNSTIEIINGENPTAIVFLRSNTVQINTEPDWCMAVDEYGEMTSKPDKSRFVVLNGKSLKLNAPQDAHYLYFHSKTILGDSMPSMLIINGFDVLHSTSNKKTAEEKIEMQTIFFDDFDDELSDKWKKIQNDANEVKEYHPGIADYSSLFYTEDSNAYTDSSVLVLKCRKKDQGDETPLGNNAINDEPRTYKAAYISTQNSVAIKEGRISAKIKFSHAPIDGFLFTFFTFPQDKEWPKGPEFDIAETVCHILTEERTVHSGNTYYEGDYDTAFGAYTHYRNDDDTDNISLNYYNIIQYCHKNGISTPSNWNVEYLRNSVITSNWYKEWHVYSVEWDENSIRWMVDDNVIAERATLELSSVQTVWDTPQDIRFNVKAREWATADEFCMYVDWVKVESYNDVPVQAINLNNISISINETVSITPTFTPTEPRNVAYTIQSSDESIVSVQTHTNQYEVKETKITGKAAGEATLTLLSENGIISKQITVTVT